MATLTGEQLKDSYQSLVTIGDSITSDPTSGQLENGKGSPIGSITLYKNTNGVADFSELNFSVLSNDNNTNPRGSILGQKDGTNNGLLIFNTSVSGTLTERLRIRSGGDISFRDGSANEAFYWDASTARLGIGTTSPDTIMEIKGADPVLTIRDSSTSGADGNASLILGETGATDNLDRYVRLALRGTASGPTMAFDIDANEKMRIDSNGNVGIGVIPKTGGTTWQHVQFGGTGNLIARFSDSTVDASFANNQYVNASNVDSYITTGAAARMLMNDDVISFSQAASGTADTAISWSEAMRIDSSGRVGIGTDSPSTPLHIKDDDGGLVQTIESGDSSAAYTKYINSTTGSGVITDGLLVGIDTDESATFWQYEATHMKFGTSGTERMRILSGGGITFNGDTASANALDDYEEGTFDFGVAFGGGSTAITYSTRQGKYTKIGNKVTVTGQITLSSKGTDTGTATITGLPFTIASGADAYSGVSIGFVNNISFADQMLAYGIVNSANIQLSETTNAGAHSLLDDTNFANNSSIIVTLTYFV